MIVTEVIEQYFDFFTRVSLFHGLNKDQIRSLMAIMAVSEIKKGAMVTREGEHGDTMFILLKGEVEISKRLMLASLAEADSIKQKALIRLSGKQHAFFGEMALFLENPERSASIRATLPSTLAVIQKKDLLAVLKKNSGTGAVFYKNIAVELTNRLIKSNQDILKLTTAFSLALGGD